MLEQDMYAVIQITSDSPDYSVFEHFGAEDIFEQTRTIDLIRADSTYDVNIMLLKRGAGDAEDQLVGGWIGNWTVSLQQMLDAKEIVFHVPQKYPLPATDDDLMDLYELMTNRTRCNSCVPEIIRADEAGADEAGLGAGTDSQTENAAGDGAEA